MYVCICIFEPWDGIPSLSSQFPSNYPHFPLTPLHLPPNSPSLFPYLLKIPLPPPTHPHHHPYLPSHHRPHTHTPSPSTHPTVTPSEPTGDEVPVDAPAQEEMLEEAMEPPPVPKKKPKFFVHWNRRKPRFYDYNWDYGDNYYSNLVKYMDDRSGSMWLCYVVIGFM